MAEVKWIKLSVNMFEDEKIKLIRNVPEGNNILIVWVYLLVLAGKCNDGGYIYLAKDVPYTDEMLSTVIDMPLNTTRLAIETFVKLKMIEIVDDLIYINNWEKHQNIEGLEKIREQNRLRKQRQRERERLKKLLPGNSHVTVTGHHATEEDKNKKEDIEEDKEPPTPHEKIKNLYNSICISLPKTKAISERRKKHLKARWKQFNYELATFEAIFKKAEASDFCKGKNERGWKVDFDWLIKNDSNMLKVLEGKYDNRRGTNGNGVGKKADGEFENFDWSKFE